MSSSNLLASVGLAGLLVLAPGVSRADEVDTTTTVNTPTIASGAVLFGLSYGAAAITAAVSDNAADEHLYLPLIGPWMSLADRSDQDDCGGLLQEDCDRSTGQEILIGVDGVLQALGAATVVYGILTPRTVVVHHDDDIRVVPVSMKGGGKGLAIKGRF